jgi:hypothetical protein
VHEWLVERPKPGAEPTVDESSNAVLTSIHAPDAGTLMIEFDRRYSEAWQRCARALPRARREHPDHHGGER